MSDGETLHTETLHSGRMLHLVRETVVLPNGHQTTLELVRHPGAAAVVPVDATGDVLLVRQYRHATGGYLLEVPAGKLDPGEEPEICARRELIEETGFRATRVIPLGVIWPTPGFCDERIWLYAAFGLLPDRQATEPDEVLALERLPWAEAVERAEDGRIEDAKSVCALLRARRHLQSGAYRP